MPNDAPPRRLDWLGLVVDRTCPDRDHWSAARALLYNPPADDDAPGRAAYADYNLAVREGIARALGDLPADRVHLAWFADGPGDGVSAPEWVAPPLTLWGEFAAGPPHEAVQHLRFCTYTPGLDLWDPVGEALELAAAPLLRQPRRGAVLLVGNSPPDVPVEGDSPLADLLSFRGLETGARRRSHLFPPLLRELGRLGVPAAYLFLTHDRCAPGEEDNLLLYQELETRVARALEHHLPVVRAPADAEGVRAGLASAGEACLAKAR